jgi:replicative DNA helicase
VADPEVLARLLDVCAQWSHVKVVDAACTLNPLDALIEGARPLWPAPVRLVCVDYAGLVSLRRMASPYERAALVAIELKNIAKRHRVALMVLYQISRAGGSGGDEVTLSMARDSCVVEEAADYALGVWRPELDDDLDAQERADVEGQFKVRVLKNRNRALPPKAATLHFEGKYLQITSPPINGGSRG